MLQHCCRVRVKWHCPRDTDRPGGSGDMIGNSRSATVRLRAELRQKMLVSKEQRSLTCRSVGRTKVWSVTARRQWRFRLAQSQQSVRGLVRLKESEAFSLYVEAVNQQIQPLQGVQRNSGKCLTGLSFHPTLT
jgi:hypothetical protein